MPGKGQSVRVFSIRHFLRGAATLALLVTAVSISAADAPPGPVRRLPLLTFEEGRADGRIVRVPDVESERLRRAALADRQVEERLLLGPHPASRRGLQRLAGRGLGPALLADGAVARVPVAQPDTVRVVLVRIGFETDRSGPLTSVTDDGDFRLEPDPTVPIDPAPHDLDFYKAHFFALSRFYHYQSGGRLVVLGRVLPEGQNDCYKLSDIADYGPGAGGSWTLEGLETLVRDMITLTDEQTQLDGGLNMADFDDDDPNTYIIFIHAGADWQSDINRDSPNDIPSFFVVLGEQQALISVDSDSGLPGAISECSIIPETTTQDGFLGSIAGVLAHEFGHALGLPDIYDTATGLPSVGVWDLMDSGPNLLVNIGLPDPSTPDPEDYIGYVVGGLLPPSLSAWCKWFLGWLDVAEVGGGSSSWRLPAVQIPRDEYPLYAYGSVGGTPFDLDVRDPQALIGSASTGEFFLVENRWVPAGPDDFPDETGVGFLQDQTTGVMLYLAGDDNRNTGMYDYFLPGGGLLVWHVAEAELEGLLDDNLINMDGRGLRLVEADGITDVGLWDSGVIGFYGSETDPFHAGTSDQLRQEGLPSSRAWDRSWTGFEMWDISAPLPAMTLGAGVAPLRPASPIELPAGGDGPRGLDPVSLTPFAMDSGAGPAPALVVAGDGGHLFALRLDGTSVAAAVPGAPAGALLDPGPSLAGPPVVADGDGGDILVVGRRDGTALGLSAALDGGVAATAWGPVSVADTLAYAPVPLRGPDGGLRYLCCAGPGVVHLLDDAGARVGAALQLVDGMGAPSPFVAAPRALRLPGEDGDRVLVFTAAGWYVLSHSAGGLDQVDPDLRGAVEVLPAADGILRVALLPGADRTRLLLIGRGGANAAYDVDADGVSPLGVWTVRLDADPAGDPAVADVSGDGRLEVVVPTTRGLHVLAANGVEMNGFPAVLADRFPVDPSVVPSGPVVVFDATGDGRNEIYLLSTEGHLFGFDAAGELLARTPLRVGSPGGSSLAVAANAAGGRDLWLADRGAWRSVRSGGAGDNGRLSGLLTPSAQTADAGTAEWLGLLGGPARNGPVGVARDLGAVAATDEQRGRFFAYPNPATGDHATLRFHSDFAAQALLRLHNLEGELVGSAVVPAAAGEITEYDWPLDGVAGGVYLFRLELVGAGRSERRLLRLGVER